MKPNNIGLGVIGGGVMAEAIISRLLLNKIYSADRVIVSDPQPSRQEFWQQNYGVFVTGDNSVVAEVSPMILLAIKPQVLDKVVASLGSTLPPVIISILAGVKLDRLQDLFKNSSIVRVMPNTPATVGVGMSAITPGNNVTQEQINQVKQIFIAVGEVVEVPESLMDAVTGLSGSGPAYVAVAIEALADGGVAVGLPRAIAQKLAIQTVLGTATLLKESNLHPAEVKDRVSSPGGTTIAGISALEECGFRSALIKAVRASYERSQELGGK